jgi:ABC-type taurine transport system substrate-binding protein
VNDQVLSDNTAQRATAHQSLDLAEQALRATVGAQQDLEPKEIPRAARQKKKAKSVTHL